MDIGLFSSLKALLQQNALYGGWITFTIACLESLAVIGSVIPGSITMTAIGSLIGNGALPLNSTIMFAVTGALLGDTISFLAGLHYAAHIRRITWIKERSHWIYKSEQFFKRYGVISLVIGRFFGPMRSMIPMIAGFCKMPPSYFALGIIPSAILWAIVYLSPGVLLGFLSTEFPHTLSYHFFCQLITIFVIFALMIWLINRFLGHLKAGIGYFTAYLHTSSHTPLTYLRHHRRENTHATLISYCYAIIIGMLFFAIGYEVSNHGFITGWNLPVYHLFQSMHSPFWNSFMMHITFFADKWALFPAGFILAITLYLSGQRKQAYHWLTSLIVFSLCIKGCKVLFHIDRPPVMLHILGHTSFPSGHVSLTCAIFFTLLFMSKPTKQWVRQFLLISWITLIGISRLYCGAHWLTDILGGLCLGSALAHISNGIAKRYDLKHHEWHLKTIIIVLVSWIAATAFEDRMHYHMYYGHSFPEIKIQTIDLKLWHQNPGLLPTKRANRLDTHHEELNVQWSAPSIEIIAETLTQHQWSIDPPSGTNWFEEIYTALSDPNHAKLKRPLTPLHQKKAPALTAWMKIDPDMYRFELWQSSHQLNHNPIWVGSLYRLTPTKNYAEIQPLQDLSNLPYQINESIIQIYQP